MRDRLQRQSGLTLVELMIALLLASILLAGLVSLYVSARQTQRTNHALTTATQNIRYFTTFISRDIRLAGYNPESECNLGGPGIHWQPDNKTLTIRYCPPGEAAGKQTVEYRFKPRHIVAYREYSGDHATDFQRLTNGIKLESICFGIAQSPDEDDSPKTMRYDCAPDAASVDPRTVRLTFRAIPADTPDTPIPAAQMNLIVTVRNNATQPL